MAACTFFGHRDIFENIETQLYEAIENLILNHAVDEFYVGNNGSFDFIVYTTLSKLYKKYSNIKFCAVLAYLGRDIHPSITKTIYPEGIENIPLRYAILWRNKWMLHHSEFVITYINRPFGGAYRFHKMAKSMKKTVFNIYEQNI